MPGRFDSAQHQSKAQPLISYDREQALLNADALLPTTVFTHNLPCPVIRANFVVHNTHSSDLRVRLRHVLSGQAVPGTVANQFFDKTLEPGETQYVGLNKVMKEDDVIVGWAGTANLVTVHVDYEFED